MSFYYEACQDDDLIEIAGRAFPEVRWDDLDREEAARVYRAVTGQDPDPENTHMGLLEDMMDEHGEEAYEAAMTSKAYEA